MIFSQALEVTEVSLADSVSPAKGRTLELTRADLGDVMSQLAAYRFLKFYFLQHWIAPLWV
jgi:hypothetical protein